MFHKVENSIRKPKIKKKHDGIVRERARCNQIVIEYESLWHPTLEYNEDDFPKQTYILQGKEYEVIRQGKFYKVNYGK